MKKSIKFLLKHIKMSMVNKRLYFRFFTLISVNMFSYDYKNFNLNYFNKLLNNSSLNTFIKACLGVNESKDLRGVSRRVKFFSFMSLDV